MLVSALHNHRTALDFNTSNAHFFPIHTYMDCQTLEIVIYDYFQINCIHLKDLVFYLFLYFELLDRSRYISEGMVHVVVEKGEKILKGIVHDCNG